MSIGLKSKRLEFLGQKVRRNVEDYGYWVAAKKSFRYLLKKVFYQQSYIIYRIDLSRTSEVPKSVQGEFTFKIVKFDDCSEIQQIEDLAEWLRGGVRNKIASGDLCLVALRNGRVAGFNLITFGKVYIPLINLNRTFRFKEAWSEHIAVRSEFRKEGLASGLRYRIFQELRQGGIKRFYGGTVSSNLASLKLVHRVGFREIVAVKYTRILGWKNWRYRRVRT